MDLSSDLVARKVYLRRVKEMNLDQLILVCLAIPELWLVMENIFVSLDRGLPFHLHYQK